MRNLAFILLFLIPFWTSTGDTFPTSGTNHDQSGTSTVWTNPGDAISDNTTDATCNAGNISDFLFVSNFGFSLPTGSTINGVLVRVEASEHSGGTEALRAQLGDSPPAAGAIGTPKTTSNEGSLSGTTKAVYTYGSTSDLWGATLTEAIVESSSFGVFFYFSTSHDVRIDYVTMAIEYTSATGRRVTIISKK